MDYSQILNKFFKKNEILEKSKAGLPENSFNFKPFVTVSRDPGSGGRPIAELVAKTLGFEFYDEKLVEEIAKSAKLRKEVLEEVDEKQRSLIQDIVHNTFNPDYVSETKYVSHLCKVVLSIAQTKKAVFLGRGINFILPMNFGLNVQITAPYRVCVARAVRYEKVDYQKARDIIREVLAERQGFVKQYFGKDIHMPKYYDLTLNTTYMSMEDARDLVVLAFKRKMNSK